MIVFQKIRWKNLLSTGNTWNEIKLNEFPNALIIGENGTGKSTILDALTFSLFGKPFRGINKPQLVNSINEKNCLVEIEFTTNGKRYKVIRGIKPAVFEIYCNDVCLNQNSASKDYQDHLEKFILKMNYKSFTQIVILGSASFTPFMQLTPADRRMVIEDLLDIQIFSVMSSLVKIKFQANKDALEKNKLEGLGKDEKKKFIEKTIASLRETNELKLKQLKEQEDEYTKNINALEDEIRNLGKERDKLLSTTQTHQALRDKYVKLIKLKTQIEVNHNKHKEKVDFFHKYDACPTCRQTIDDDFSAIEIGNINKKLKEFEDAIAKITSQLDAIMAEIENVDMIAKQVENIRNDISFKESRLASLRESLEDVKKLSVVDDKTLLESQAELALISEEITKLAREKNELVNEKLLIDTATQLLKDGGIKTKIIKQYLPVINKHINKYLLQMGFFVNFNINENFEETIKSRYRDVFSYQNFSEGEKMRIDLALLFTWRAIAKMRNSVNTNLLILDEVFDGSLDTNGTDEFLKIMTGLNDNSNVFVISHKTDQLVDKFKKTYRFKKVKNFSVMTTK